MRRNLVALTLLGALAGCTSGGVAAPPARPAPAPADPSAAASADRALTGDTQAICDQAARTGAGFGEMFIDDLQLRVDSAAQGDQAKAQAQQKITRDVQNYSVALADMAALTTDAALKQALSRMSKEVTALKGDVTKIDSSKLADLAAMLDRACGKS
ncbi:hypothetical protein HH310_39425 [Actinoplanes sp. TBRC 11911]|uniref:hypothetical protein n=1 Tax=Actinoplanes sp. TBRC 11911 TaxID=2729386 RepID=UPI00145C4B9F|nr:hypothetical protein [Actinoplanes sp. TBRC 11911]NMO57232.1 hypothetical protein [Actinoplanes sp. TBRC 11911]